MQELLGQTGIRTLKERFRSAIYPLSPKLPTDIGPSSTLIQGPAVVFYDQSIDVIRMVRPLELSVLESSISDTATPAMSSASSADNGTLEHEHEAPQPKGVQKEERIPRPPNAFILYRQHHHPLVKQANPEMHNNEICKLLFIVPLQDLKR